MDRDSGSALLLPEAQSALHDSNRIVLSALDALPGEVCVLDANGVVVMANKAWRVSGADACARGTRCARGRKHLRCLPRRSRKRTCARGGRDRGAAPGAHRHAPVVELPICLPASTRAQRVHADHGGHLPATGPVNALLTREWHSEHQQPDEDQWSHCAKTAPHRQAARAGANNHLLAALPPEDYAQLAAASKR